MQIKARSHAEAEAIQFLLEEIGADYDPQTRRVDEASLQGKVDLAQLENGLDLAALK